MNIYSTTVSLIFDKVIWHDQEMVRTIMLDQGYSHYGKVLDQGEQWRVMMTNAKHHQVNAIVEHHILNGCHVEMALVHRRRTARKP